jgi:DNA (cytosine-5)-methyltransferase 1
VDTTITTLEFCAGYGGIGLGLKNIFGERLRTIAYCELEGFAQANLLSKMEKGLMDVAPIWNDLKTFPYESFHGLVDILIAGYPCQPFSSAGKRAGKEDPRHLWPWIADGIRLLQPRMCFLENVEGHISLGLSTVISDLEELGYKSSFGIFSASEVGAVHQRKRVFIMAHNSSTGLEGATRTGIQGIGEGFAEYAGAMANTNSRGMSGSRNELGNSGEVGQGWENTSQNGIIGNAMADTRGICSERANQNRANRNWICELSWESKIRSEAIGCGNLWPSRPGQPQYAWEPPRVVGNASQLFCDASNNNRGISEQGEQIPQFGNSSWEATMGNPECRRRTGRDVNRETTKDIGTGCINGNENSECSEIKPEVGGNIDGTTYGVDIAELSSLCHSELAEIREWMVKGDNRTDELRSCGNGVVPATAERAFRVLMEELKTI